MSGRLSRLVLVLRCLGKGLVGGRSVRVPRDPQVILVVLSGKLGDIVCGTPVLRALRARYPLARLIAAGSMPLVAQLLADSGLADEFLDIEREKVKGLKKKNADAALLTGPSFVPVAKLYLAGIPLVVAPSVVGGYSPAQTKPYRLLKRVVATYPYDIRAYAPRERLRALEPLGLMTEDTAKHLGYSEGARERVRAWLAAENPDHRLLVGISPTAGNKIKEWPVERFAAVADHAVAAHQARVVIIGAQGDRAVVEEMRRQMRAPESAVCATEFSLDELKALIASLSLYIAADTGPIYIAEAFGTPTIDLVGPVDENVQPPRGPRHVVLVPDREKPQLSILNAREYDEAEAMRQAQGVSASQACAAVDELLSLLHERA